MDEVLAISLASMHQDMGRLDHVALNLANATTPGYKREVVAMKPFADIVQDMSRGLGPATQSHGMSQASMQVLFDVRPGTLKMTGEPMDVAITGDAFFEVSTDHGLAYTRQGNFHLDAQGRLVTASGYPVMGKNGEIFLTTQSPVIDATGAISEPSATAGPSATQPGTPVAQIKLVRFDEAKNLQHLGDGLLAGESGLSLVGESESQLHQGALENSNVSHLSEMIQLIQVARHFESMQKITQGYDEMIGTAIHKLGDLS